MLTDPIKQSINQSILCWLATSSEDHLPNVSPKEVFTYHENTIIVANIASPQTVKNIQQNPKVCISFIDILVQKGFQIKGTAAILTPKDANYCSVEKKLLVITQGMFPFSSITQITIEHTKEIIAPKYILYPETTEQQQIVSAKKNYGL